tara:strand:+ start:96 stop:389 length:294 start_codon:yes stop_codon:yes gene_type:complete
VDSILPYIFDLKNEIDVLLSKYKDQKEKNVNLSNEKEKLLEKVHDLENLIKELKERVEVVDVVKGMSVLENDSSSFARGRVNGLIRKIDKCISLLNE